MTTAELRVELERVTAERDVPAVTVINADCREAMRAMDAASVDAIVSDPPYGLSFMGKGWDRGVPGVDFWAEALRVVKPGAYMLAFGGTRTFHRLACAIEDAGWEIQDCLSWLYGSGFPKHRSKLKPAWEPIILARRPAPRATPLNIDDCRIPSERPTGWAGGPSSGFSGGLDSCEPGGRPVSGRWPANLVLDDAIAATLPAARYFYCAKATPQEREAGLSHVTPARQFRRFGDGIGNGPNTTAQRNIHPTVKPVTLMRWLVRLITPPVGLVLDPFTGSGTTGVAAVMEGRRFVGCELSAEYAAIARARIAHAEAQAEPELGIA